MGIFTEYSTPPPQRIFLTQVLCRVAAFYSVCTFVLGSSSLVEAYWGAGMDEVLAEILREEGVLLLLLSGWFLTLTGFFQQRPLGPTLSSGFARCIYSCQLALFCSSMTPYLMDSQM